MMKKKLILVAISLILALVLAAGSAAVVPGASVAAQTDDGQGDVLDVIRDDARAETMLALVRAGGLADNLDQGGPYTLLVPTNEAFTAFDALPTRPRANLTEILLYHVIVGQFTASQLEDHDSLTTLLGDHIDVGTQDGSARFDGSAQIIDTIEANNGIVHIIDTVLIPQLEGQESDDEADGDTTTPEGDDAEPSDSDDDEADAERTGSILATLQADGRFDTFLSLLGTANLTSRVRDAADMTLFVPTDAAFDALSDEYMEKLMTDIEEGGELDHVLRYHMIGDSLTLNQIATDDLIPTLDGRPIFVDVDDDGQILLNGSRRMVGSAIEASNGIIYVVDSVMIP